MKSPYLSQMSSRVPFIIILFTSAVAQIPTAYEVLQKYDFLVGLLPKSVTSYILNNATGEFLVTLSDKCSFSTDGYDLQFKPTISGVISLDKVNNIKGVSVKLLFFWMDIVAGTRDEDELDSVGMFSAGFDVEAFEQSPQCGCGSSVMAMIIE
ncbi:hypothetical protein CTI12_AA111000 [Artemisia annua]|uniref:Uncharacterized protein n=1 Tax=Artemisia annua TaxID=35608 RepID=A0A2U1PV53_ARTAN|nr:hypothetical protein CTI12_AA111000 [Artemisia annua]